MHSAWMLRYGVVDEESFQSLSEESARDLSANRKKKLKGKAAIDEGTLRQTGPIFLMMALQTSSTMSAITTLKI